jgi:hypothetical protein
MTRRRQFLQAAACCAAALPGGGRANGPFAPQDLKHAAALRDRALADGFAWRLLQSLCGEVGARPAGSAADAKAQAWALARMRALSLEDVQAQPFSLNVWQRGPAAAQLLAPQPRELLIAALGNSIGTPAEGIEAELAYYPDLAALAAEPIDPQASRARGRIVFIDQKTERTRDGRGYGAAVPARINGAVQAARRGALAVAIRSIGTSREPVAHTGAMRYDLSVPSIPAFAVSVPDADAIAAAAESAGTALRLRVSMQTRADVPAHSANVIGQWRGEGERAGEIVLIGAHLDSWDVGEGAVDDGAGVAIVLAAANLIAAAGRRPRRTIRVVLFGNEENGFDGARAYGARYGGVPHQLVAESDFGAGRIWRYDTRVQELALPWALAIGEALQPLGIEPAAGNRASPGPDAAVLMRRHRWPAVGLTQDGSRYFDVHHTARDTLAQVDPADLPQNVAAWATVAWLAAQADVSFGPPIL